MSHRMDPLPSSPSPGEDDESMETELLPQEQESDDPAHETQYDYKHTDADNEEYTDQYAEYAEQEGDDPMAEEQYMDEHPNDEVDHTRNESIRHEREGKMGVRMDVIPSSSSLSSVVPVASC